MAKLVRYTKDGRKEILRFKPITQVAHFFLFLGMLISFITGLPMFFKLNDVPVLIGLGELLGLGTEPPTSQLISILHDIVGPVLMFIGILIALAASIRPKTIREALPTKEDIQVFMAIIRSRLGKGKRPKVGFYHPLQKLWIWTVVIGLILLGVSGVPIAIEKWFNVRIMGDYLRGIMSLLHIIGAFMFFVALPIHFIMAIAPINWPILKSQFLFRGYVDFAWWKHHHPKYVEELEREEKKEGEGGGRG